MESKIYLADGTEIVAEINTRIQTVTSSGHAVPDLFGRISITHRGWVNLEVPPDWVNADWSVFTQIVNDRNGVRGYFEKYLTQAEAEELVERIGIRGR